jgi:hypothetical protein
MDTKKDDGGGWTTIPIREKPPVVNKDHPTVKKILDYIEKEIKPIEDDTERHINYHSYLGCLEQEELVIYGIYKRISLVPSIYLYYKTKELSESDWNKLENLLGSEF